MLFNQLKGTTMVEISMMQPSFAIMNIKKLNKNNGYTMHRKFQIYDLLDELIVTDIIEIPNTLSKPNPLKEVSCDVSVHNSI